MRDFDQLRAERSDLDFKIGGETFHFVTLPMSIVGVWSEREEPVDVNDTAAFIQMLVERVADAVDDGNGAKERWTSLCASEKAPSYAELMQLARDAWEMQTTLPTEPLSSAPAGPTAIATSSKGA
jgi:hypothetical protein